MVRAHGLFVAMMLLIVPVYLAWSWSDQLGNLGGDAAFYLMMAHAWSPMTPHDALFASVAAASRFPPLYPLLLALTGGDLDLLRVHLITTLTLFLALIALYAWLVECGASRIHAAGVALVTAMLPQTALLALWPQSEYPYLALSLVCLLALARYRERPTLRLAMIAAVAAAATAMTRTIGIALLPPLALTFLTGPRRRDFGLAIAAMVPLVVWIVLHRSSSDSYVNILQSSYPGNGMQRLAQQLAAQPSLFRYGFAGNFLQTSGLIAVVDALGIAVVAVMLFRLVRLRADAVYAACYAGIVAIWPYPEEIARLLWPLLPVLLGTSTLQAARLAEHVSPLSRQLAGAAVVAAVFCITLPVDAFMADRWAMRGDEVATLRRFPEWYELDPRHALEVARAEQGMIELLQRLPNVVPAEDCVIAVKPQLVEYFAHRRSVLPPPSSVPDPEFIERTRQTGCSFVLMLASKDKAYPAPLYPFARIRPYADTMDQAMAESPFSGDLFMAALLGHFKDR